MAITNWMAWEAGVDLVAVTDKNLQMPNIIVHIARMVHTPKGSAASGMILYQPNPSSNPEAMGFVSHDLEVGKYFGPKIFAGTPFENAPALKANIEVLLNLPNSVGCKVKVGNHLIETTLSELSQLELINRAPAQMPPFFQQGLEAKAGKASLRVNGKEIPIIVPPAGISGGPAAVWSPAGIYAR